ncbi:MAG: sugar transferase [Proteobacteria bacterium]|nr:sugar transferase [Pseudomonadota bacterium]
MYFFFKRFLDIIGSLIGIIIFSPLMLITAAYIYAVSPGPVLATTKPRVGKNGKYFNLLKFRSMIPNAQEWLESQPELFKKYKDNNFKLDPDPRLIKGGKAIRKYSLDELPQFFNILVGDMSIVGPRAYFDFELDEQLRNHPQTKEDIELMKESKPGLTGTWQVSGRSGIGFVERIKMDADYSKKKSILYDLNIILKTPYVVIFGKGAY